MFTNDCELYIYQREVKDKTSGLLQPILLNNHPSLICAEFCTSHLSKDLLDEQGDSRPFDSDAKAQHQHRRYVKPDPSETFGRTAQKMVDERH